MYLCFSHTRWRFSQSLPSPSLSRSDWLWSPSLFSFVFVCLCFSFLLVQLVLNVKPLRAADLGSQSIFPSSSIPAFSTWSRAGGPVNAILFVTSDRHVSSLERGTSCVERLYVPRTLPRPVQHLRYQKQQTNGDALCNTRARLLCGAGGLLFPIPWNRQPGIGNGKRRRVLFFRWRDPHGTECVTPRGVFSLCSPRYSSLGHHHVKDLDNAVNRYVRTWVRTIYFIRFTRISTVFPSITHTVPTLDLVFSCLHGIVCHVRPASLSLSPSFSLSLSFYSLSLPSRAVPLPRASCKRALSHLRSYLDRSVDMNFPIANFNVNI